MIDLIQNERADTVKNERSFVNQDDLFSLPRKCE